MNPKTRARILLIIRIFLGLVFLLSGIGKLINSDDAKYLVELLSMEFYWLIEYKILIVTSITIFELILAGLLLSGKQVRPAMIGSFLLLFSLTSVLVYFQLEDMDMESCGCFGAFDILSSPKATISKNVVLMIVLVTGYMLHQRSNPELPEAE